MTINQISPFLGNIVQSIITQEWYLTVTITVNKDYKQQMP
jgi:hypothetical protein